MKILPRDDQIEVIADCWAREQWCAILAPPMSGKSTLAEQIATEYLRRGNSIVCKVAFDDSDVTLKQANHRVIQAISPSDFTSDADSPLPEQMKALIHHARQPIYLLLDELDRLPDEVSRLFTMELRRFLNSPIFTDSRRLIRAVLFGAEKLLLATDQASSPLYNLVNVQFLPDLTREQTRELFLTSVDREFAFDELATDQLFSATGGQPYLIQELVRSAKMPDGSGKSLEREDYLSRLVHNWKDGSNHEDSYFQRIINSMHDDSRVCEAIISLCESRPRKRHPIFDGSLQMSGAVVEKDGYWHFRGEMVSEVIREYLHDLRKADLLATHGDWQQSLKYYRRVNGDQLWQARNQSSDNVQPLLDLFLGGLPEANRQRTFDDAIGLVLDMCQRFLGACRACLWQGKLVGQGEEVRSEIELIKELGTNDTVATMQEELREALVSVAIRHRNTLHCAGNLGLIHPLTSETAGRSWTIELHFLHGLSKAGWVERVLRYVEAMIASCLDRAERREKAARRRGIQRTLIHRIALKLQRASRLDEVFGELIDGVTKELDFPCAQLSLVFRDECKIRAVKCDDQIFSKIKEDTVRDLDGNDILALVVREKAHRIVADCSDPNSNCEHLTITKTGMKSMIAIPLIDVDEAVGVLQVGDCERESAFGPDDIELLQPLVDSAAVAISVTQNRERYDRLLEETGDAIAFIDRNGNVQHCNAAYREFLDTDIHQPTLLKSSQKPDVPLVKIAFDENRPIQTVRPFGERNYVVTVVANKDPSDSFAGGVELVSVRHPIYGLADSLGELLKLKTETELIEGIVRCLCQRLGYSRARFYRLEHDRLVSRAAHGMKLDTEEDFRTRKFILKRHADEKQGDGFECLRIARPLIIMRSDLRQETDRDLPIGEFCDDGRHRRVVVLSPEPLPFLDELDKQELPEWLDVPIIAQGVPLGKVSVDLKGSKRSLGPEDLEMLALFGDWVSNAFLRLEELEKSKRQAAFLSDVNTLAEGRGLEAVAWDALVDITLEGGIEFNRAALFLKRAGSEEIRGFLCHGASSKVEWEKVVRSVRADDFRYSFVEIARRQKMHDERPEEGTVHTENVRQMTVNMSRINDPLVRAVSEQQIVDVTPKQPMPPDFYESLGWEASANGLVCPLVYENECEGVIYVDKAYSDDPITADNKRDLYGRCFNLAAIARPLRLTQHLTTQVRGVAHANISPMSAIRGLVESFRDSLPKEQQSLADMVVAEAQRAADNFRRVIRFSALDPIAWHAKKTKCNLRKVLQERLMPYRKLLELDGGTVEMATDDGPLDVFVDPELIGDLIAELANNAVQIIQSSDDDRRLLRIGLRQSARTVQLDIENSGRLVPEPQRARLFEPFVSFRGSTGIGLSVARQIVTSHEGTIQYEISQEHLNRFRIILPTAPPFGDMSS